MNNKYTKDIINAAKVLIEADFAFKKSADSKEYKRAYETLAFSKENFKNKLKDKDIIYSDNASIIFLAKIIVRLMDN